MKHREEPIKPQQADVLRPVCLCYRCHYMGKCKLKPPEEGQECRGFFPLARQQLLF